MENSRGSKVQGFNNSNSIRVSMASNNMGRVSVSNDNNAFKLITSNQSGVSGNDNRLENFLSATQLELRSKQALMNNSDVEDFDKKKLNTGQSYHLVPDVIMNGNKHNQQVRMSENFSPKRPRFNSK